MAKKQLVHSGWVVMAVISIMLLLVLVIAAPAYFALPNLLARRALIPELIQDDVTAERLAEAVRLHLDDKQASATLVAQFREMHLGLRRDAAQQAAAAVMEMLERPGTVAAGDGG